jgi:hypothetical protein
MVFIEVWNAERQNVENQTVDMKMNVCMLVLQISLFQINFILLGYLGNTCGGHKTPAGGCQEESHGFDIFIIFNIMSSYISDFDIKS